MINTLKLAQRLEAAQMSREQAEAFAEGLAEGLTDREDLNTVKRDVAVLKWMVGFNIALSLAAFLKLFL